MKFTDVIAHSIKANEVKCVFGLQGGHADLDGVLPRICRILSVEHKISQGDFITQIEGQPIPSRRPRKYYNLAGELIVDLSTGESVKSGGGKSGFKHTGHKPTKKNQGKDFKGGIGD